MSSTKAVLLCTEKTAFKNGLLKCLNKYEKKMLCNEHIWINLTQLAYFSPWFVKNIDPLWRKVT